MAQFIQTSGNTFDFSQEAGEFKSRLWNQLSGLMDSSVQMLEDDDLEWLHAAGTPCVENKTDDKA